MPHFEKSPSWLKHVTRFDPSCDRIWDSEFYPVGEDSASIFSVFLKEFVGSCEKQSPRLVAYWALLYSNLAMENSWKIPSYIDDFPTFDPKKDPTIHWDHCLVGKIANIGTYGPRVCLIYILGGWISQTTIVTDIYDE